MKHSTKFRLVLGASIFALTATLGTAALAAGDTATLQGHVAPGTSPTVTVTDTVTGRSTTVNVGADGSYAIVGLRPSSYHVTAGSASDDITLAVGETSTLDLDAAAAAPASTTTVTVTGRRRKEVRTSEIATQVSNQQIENLPQNDRNFMNFAALAPGVAVSADPNKRQFKGAGLGATQVNVYIDGQSVKDQVGNGGVAGQSFSSGNPFPQLAIQEFKVSTQNFKAEYEQAGSAIITAVTKTGGTEFHGSAFYEIQNKDMIGQPYFQRSSPKADYDRKQYGFDIGGPIIKNKLHFYVAYEGTDQKNPSKGVSFDSAYVPADIISANAGNFPDTFKSDLWFGKLTWFVNDADTIDLSYFDRKENDEKDYGGIEARSHGRDLQVVTQTPQLEWKHRGDGWLNEMSLTYQKSTTGTPNLTDGPEIILTGPQRDGDGNAIDGTRDENFRVAVLGGNSFQQFNGQEITTFKDSITFTGLDWHGSHVVKMGVKVENAKLSRFEHSFDLGSYFYDGDGYSASSSTPYKAQIQLLAASDNLVENTEVGLFIQDDWTYDEHWTFNLGLRWDYESNMMNNKFVTPDNVATALRNYVGWQAAGINAEDYISNGSNRDAFLGAFQPRLGFSYDVRGDRDTVLFGGIGRYYDRNVYLNAALETIKNLYSNAPTVYFCGAGGQPVCGPLTNGLDDQGRLPWNASYSDPAALRTEVQSLGLNGDIWVLNNKTKQPYSDQINLGVRQRFDDTTLAVTVAHIDAHNIFAYVRGNRMPDGTYSPVGDGVIRDNFPIEGRPTGFTGRVDIGDNGGASKYNAVYITLDKPYTPTGKWGYTATVTFADSKTRGPEQDQSEFFMGARQDAYPWGYTQGVDKMRFVGTGIISGPWDTTISGTVTLASGPAYGGNHGVCNPTNPTDCYTYFNYNEGNFPEDKLAYQNLDLRIAKDFELPNGQVVTLDGQVYNVFDHVNRVYSAWGGKENNTIGNARSYQVGLKYKW